MDKYISFKRRMGDACENAKKAKRESIELKETPSDISQTAGDKLARPLLKAYPKHCEGKSHGRSFVASWYDRYSWLEYSQECDAIFCFPCRHFCHPGYGNAEETFTKTGFRRWKKAHGKDGAIMKHINSQCHKMSVMSWNDFERNKAAKTSVEKALNENYRKKVNENRHYMKTIGEIVLITATQNIAQRGHREGDDVSNPGNVKKILRFAAKHDPVVADRIKSGPKNEKYTSHSIQNEVIETLATMVLDEVVESVQKSRFLSIQADESKDVRKTEQLSLVIRFFAEDVENIQECFLSFIAMESLDAESTCKAILSKLERMGLDYKGCLVGMGFDGASVMSGKLGGVQKLIKDKAPMAYYVHCYAHRLNLILIDTVKVVPHADNVFSLLEKLYIFVSNSIVHECFISLQKEMHPGEKIQELQNLSETRWWARATSCNNALLRFECIMRLLHQVSNKDKGARATDARGLLAQMNYKFLQLLHFFKEILSMVNKISEQLQDPNLDLAKAWQLISMLKKELECIRNSEHIKYNEEVGILCRKCGINIEGKQVRPRRPPESLSDYVVTDAIGKSVTVDPEVTFHANAFVSVLDCMLSELDRRFSSDAKAIMEGVSALSPTCESFLDHHALKEMALRYQICHDGLVHEIHLVQRLVGSNCKTVLQFLLQICPYKQAFDCLYNLLVISIMLPVTTASCERSFSKMKLVKTFLRNSMCHDRLSQLALLSIESNRAEALDLEQFVDEFDSRHDNRRIKLH